MRELKNCQDRSKNILDINAGCLGSLEKCVKYQQTGTNCQDRLWGALFDMLYGKFDATEKSKKVLGECKP